MYNKKGDVIYVGKAKNLKKRISSYFSRQLDNKTIRLVSAIAKIETTITNNEREALLLEINLINQYKPRYNILFKDDKSYPYLAITHKDIFPRLSMERGCKDSKAYYFGPYPSVNLARQAFHVLLDIFKLRQCEDFYFKTRTRPCLQHQLKRCSAPCTGLISAENYRYDVENAVSFLKGQSQEVLNNLIVMMEQASYAQDYEQAALLRDKIRLLRQIAEQQIIYRQEGNIDIIGMANYYGFSCIHLLSLRDGKISETRQYFQQVEDKVPEDIIKAFIVHRYFNKKSNFLLPQQILLRDTTSDLEQLILIINEQHAQAINLITNLTLDHKRWLEMAETSAVAAIKHHMEDKAILFDKFKTLTEALQAKSLIKKIICFDISHTFGEETYGSCVVFGLNGALKKEYRLFKVAKALGDDYKAMAEVASRYFKALLKKEQGLPDLVLVDGGVGQRNVVQQVLNDLSLKIDLLAIAKGPSRKAGLETLYLGNQDAMLDLDATHPALHLLQQVRDEAHRFAITAHRRARQKKRFTSKLEEIPNIGKERRRALIQRFGGLKEVEQASIEELAKVPGVGKELAQKIYEHLHGQ